MKNRSISGLKREKISVQREKTWRDYIVDRYLNKLDLTCERESVPFIDINPTCLNHIFLKVVQNVFLPVKIEEFVHSMEVTKMNG